MAEPQYRIEREQVENNGGDLKKFDDEWMTRAVDAYKRNVRPGNRADVNKFRSGGFTI